MLLLSNNHDFRGIGTDLCRVFQISKHSDSDFLQVLMSLLSLLYYTNKSIIYMYETLFLTCTGGTVKYYIITVFSFLLVVVQSCKSQVQPSIPPNTNKSTQFRCAPRFLSGSPSQNQYPVYLSPIVSVVIDNICAVRILNRDLSDSPFSGTI